MDELLAQVLRKIFEDGMNDGQAIFEALCNLSREARDDRDAVFVALTYILDRIEGPYAFLLIDVSDLGASAGLCSESSNRIISRLRRNGSCTGGTA